VRHSCFVFFSHTSSEPPSEPLARLPRSALPRLGGKILARASLDLFPLYFVRLE